MLASRTDADRCAALEGPLERSLSLADAVRAFVDDKALASRGVTDKTAQTYRSLLAPLRDDPRPVSSLDARRCRELMAERARSGRNGRASPSTIRTFRDTLASFCAWLVTMGYLFEDPMRGIPTPKKAESPHRYLSADELRRLWLAADDELRLVLLLLLEGLRATELMMLRWQDVRSDRIVVAFGKGGKVRAVPLSPAVRSRLKGGQGRIFDFGYHALLRRLQRLGIKAGVPHVHPHLFRHSFASLSLLAGLDESALRTLGGWSKDSETMERYVRSVREEAALDAARRLDLPGQLFGD